VRKGEYEKGEGAAVGCQGIITLPDMRVNLASLRLPPCAHIYG
jgi:hypothetical protein